MNIVETLEFLTQNFRSFFWPKADLMDHKEIHLGSRFESQIIFALDENKGYALIERYLTTEFENSKVLSNLKYSSQTVEYTMIKKLIEIVEEENDPFFSNFSLDDEMRVFETTRFINERFDS